MNNTTTNTTLVPDADGSYYYTSTNIEGPLAKGEVKFDVVRGSELDDVKEEIKKLYALFYDVQTHSQSNRESFESLRVEAEQDIAQLKTDVRIVQEDLRRTKADVYFLQDEVMALQNNEKEDF